MEQWFLRFIVRQSHNHSLSPPLFDAGYYNTIPLFCTLGYSGFLHVQSTWSLCLLSKLSVKNRCSLDNNRVKPGWCDVARGRWRWRCTTHHGAFWCYPGTGNWTVLKFFLDLKIAIILSYIYYQLPSPNVGWLSEFCFSSNKFEISDWEKSTLDLARFGIHKSFSLLLMISLSL